MQWGGPNPDNVYTRAAIDPAATYRVVGQRRRRACRAVLARRRRHAPRPLRRLLRVHARRSRRGAPTARWSCGSRRTATTRNWIASASRRADVPRAPVPLRLGARPRRDADDRAGRRAGVPHRAPSTAAGVDRRSTAPRRGSNDRSSTGARTSNARARRSRTTPSSPPSTPKGGAPTIAYGAGWWQLGRDDALLITTDVPDADYWGWTVHHRYRLDSGDFANRQTSLNMVAGLRRRRRPDPVRRRATTTRACRNWIDTEGQPEGMLVYRSIGTRSRPDARSARSCRLAALREHLPAAHPRRSARPSAASSWRSGAPRCSPATSDAWRGRRKPRPEWVAELNAFGRQLGSPGRARRRSTRRRCSTTARAATGLDDFGDDGWREPCGIFLAALDEEADLHLLGRIHRPQRDRARAGKPARGARHARCAPGDPRRADRRARARRRYRPIGYVDPARAARAGPGAPGRAARGSCCIRARRRSARRTRPTRVSRPPIRSTRSGI